MGKEIGVIDVHGRADPDTEAAVLKSLENVCPNLALAVGCGVRYNGKDYLICIVHTRSKDAPAP